MHCTRGYAPCNTARDSKPQDPNPGPYTRNKALIPPQVVLLAPLGDHGLEHVIVHVGDPGEEVVLDLVVEASVDESEGTPADSRRRLHLQE